MDGVFINWYGTRNKHDNVHPNLLFANAIIYETSNMGLIFTTSCNIFLGLVGASTRR